MEFQFSFLAYSWHILYIEWIVFWRVVFRLHFLDFSSRDNLENDQEDQDSESAEDVADQDEKFVPKALSCFLDLPFICRPIFNTLLICKSCFIEIHITLLDIIPNTVRDKWWHWKDCQYDRQDAKPLQIHEIELKPNSILA